MKTTELKPETIQVLRDLMQDLEDMIKMDSNIEVIWKLESLQNNKALQKSADFIRKTLK